MIKILNHYYRSFDKQSYILYEEDGKIRLTNGVIIWTNNISEKIDKLEINKEKCNVNIILSYLKKYYPYAKITNFLLLSA